MLIVSILNLIFVVFGLVGFVLTILMPVGIVLLVIYIFQKKKRSKKLLKWTVILLSGIPLLFIVFTLWALLNLIAALFGVNVLSNTTLPIPQ